MIPLSQRPAFRPYSLPDEMRKWKTMKQTLTALARLAEKLHIRVECARDIVLD